MSSRFYASAYTVGSTTIYQVNADPNGVFSATIGSLAIQAGVSPNVWQNADGGTTWTSLLTGSTQSLLPNLVLGEDEGPTGNSLLPALGPGVVSGVMVFTAPEDLTIRRMVFRPTVNIAPLTTIFDLSNLILFADMVVAGGGPDVGSLVDGVGVPAGMFSEFNIGSSPTLNIRMSAGDTLTIPCYNIAGQTQVPTLAYSVQLFYDRGIDATVKPRRFVGVPAAPAIRLVLPTGPASGVITVLTAPLAAGDVAVNLRSGMSDGFASLLTGLGGNLVGVAGARTPGSNDFDATIGTTGAMAAEILAALSDPANAWDAYWSFAAGPGPDDITATRKTSGAFGNADIFTSTTVPPGGIGLSPATGSLAGGTSAPISYTLATPSLDLTLDRLDVTASLTTQGQGYQKNPPLMQPVQTEFVDIEVNATSIGTVSPQAFNPDFSDAFDLELDNVPVLGGDTLDVLLRQPGGWSNVVAICLSGTAT